MRSIAVARLLVVAAVGCGGAPMSKGPDASSGGAGSDGGAAGSEGGRGTGGGSGAGGVGLGGAGGASAGADAGTSTDASVNNDAAPPLGAPLDPAICAGAWSVVYSSQPNEGFPQRNDLAWSAGTLFVAHSSPTDYSWVFSIPERGGLKHLLYEGHLAAYWLEDARLLYAQGRLLFAMPQAGGPAVPIFQYGGTAESMSWRMLDRTAAYWVGDLSSDAWTVRRHLRGGAEDTTLAAIPRTRWHTCTSLWMKQGGGQLVFGCSGGGFPLAAAISKTTGAITYLPPPPANNTRPLTVSNDGKVMWVVSERGVGLSWALGAVAGTPAVPFPTSLPATLDPLQVWAAGEGAWYATAAERDTDGRVFLSLWYVDGAGRAERLACDPLARAPSIGQPATTEGRVTDGVAADGAFYLSVAYPLPSGASRWDVVRIENAPGSADRGDVGGVVGAPVGGAGGAAGTPCSSAAGAGGTTGASGTVAEFAIPTAASRPSSIVAGPDGNVWFTESAGSQIGRITPAGCITEFWTGGYTPLDLTVGPDGSFWFAAGIPGSLSGRIARMAPNGETLRGFPLLRGSTDPSAIITGPDGNLWFAQGSPSTIARMTPDGVIMQFTSPSNLYTTPASLVAGSDGNVWFCARSAPRIVRIDPATGTMTSLAVPDGGIPFSMTRGGDGNIWFVDSVSGMGYRVVSVTPAGTFTVFRAPAGTTLQDVTTTADGDVWLTTYDSNSIVRLKPSTSGFTTYPLPTASSYPTGITTGPDGNVWFVETGGNRIGRVTR